VRRGTRVAIVEVWIVKNFSNLLWWKRLSAESLVGVRGGIARCMGAASHDYLLVLDWE
jgi:hypothetical protein